MCAIGKRSLASRLRRVNERGAATGGENDPWGVPLTEGLPTSDAAPNTTVIAAEAAIQGWRGGESPYVKCSLIWCAVAFDHLGFIGSALDLVSGERCFLIQFGWHTVGGCAGLRLPPQ